MKNALLLVDIQNDFCPGGALPVPEGDLIVPLINELMGLFPVVVATKDWHPPGHISFASRYGETGLDHGRHARMVRRSSGPITASRAARGRNSIPRL